MGFGFGLFMLSLTTYQTMVIPNEVRGGAFALISIGSMAPFLLVVPFMDWILQRGFFGLFIWVGPFVAMICAMVGVTFGRIDRERVKSKGSWGTYSQLFAIPGARALFISVLIYGMTDAAIISISTLSMSKGLLSSWFVSAFAVGAIVVRLFGFRLMDVFPKDKMYPIAIAITSLSLFGATFSGSNMVFAFWGFLYGLGIGVGFPLSLAMIGDVVPLDLRPKATAMVWLILDGCFFITPVVMGYASSLLGVAGAFRVIPGILFFCSTAALPVSVEAPLPARGNACPRMRIRGEPSPPAAMFALFSTAEYRNSIPPSSVTASLGYVILTFTNLFVVCKNCCVSMILLNKNSGMGRRFAFEEVQYRCCVALPADVYTCCWRGGPGPGGG